MNYGMCVECKVRNNDFSEKELHQCSYCERWFCVEHFDSKLVQIRNLKAIVKDERLRTILETEASIEGGHPCFQYTYERFEDEKIEMKTQLKLRKEALDKMMTDYKGEKLERYILQEAQRTRKVGTKGVCPKCVSSSSDMVGYDAKTMTFRCKDCSHTWTQRKAYPYDIVEGSEESVPKTGFPRVEPGVVRDVRPPRIVEKEPKVIVQRAGTKLIAVALICLIIGMGVAYCVLLPNIKGWEQYATQLEIKCSQLTQEKATLETDLNNLQSKYDKLNYNYDLLQKEYKKLSDQYTVVYESRYKEGYDAGYTEGLTKKGYNIIDPTYGEAIQFIKTDKTDQNAYVEGKYECWNFAADFKNNAFEAGYRCGLVFIQFKDGGHAIICFNTTDKGLIFVEPQDDDIVTLIIGTHYWDRSKYLVTYDDTIVRFVIIW